MNFKHLICLFLIIASCKNTDLEKLSGDLMKSHDEVMPKTMRITEIKKKIDAIATANNTLQLEAAKINVELQKSEDMMYKWMEDFGSANNDIKDESVKVTRFRELLVQIENIKGHTNGSIYKADNFIKYHPK